MWIKRIGIEVHFWYGIKDKTSAKKCFLINEIIKTININTRS
jgi:hypothetical protein